MFSSDPGLVDRGRSGSDVALGRSGPGWPPDREVEVGAELTEDEAFVGCVRLRGSRVGSESVLGR